jgi:predicted RecA/RadA family phage recombinase
MKHTPGNQLNVVKASVVSGDPIVVGQLPGVALTSSETTTNNVTMKTDGVFNLPVKGIDGSGNSAVAIGDILYHTVADSPPVSKKATGVRFGYALEAVGSGLTATIKVKIGY